MLVADAKQFNIAAQSLLQAAAHCRNNDGLMLQPPTFDHDRYRALVRCALSLLFNAPVKVEDEIIFSGIGDFLRNPPKTTGPTYE